MVQPFSYDVKHNKACIVQVGVNSTPHWDILFCCVSLQMHSTPCFQIPIREIDRVKKMGENTSRDPSTFGWSFKKRCSVVDPSTFGRSFSKSNLPLLFFSASPPHLSAHLLYLDCTLYTADCIHGARWWRRMQISEPGKQFAFGTIFFLVLREREFKEKGKREREANARGLVGMSHPKTPFWHLSFSRR